VVAGREVSIVISALMGSLWLKEGALGQRLLGAGIIASGVVCVARALDTRVDSAGQAVIQVG